MGWNMDEKPILVFWESTRACDLACRHCRASAIAEPLPGELTHEEGLGLIDQVSQFGRPSPILILTGGDVLKRHRLFELIAHARSKGVPVSVSPAVTPLLTFDMLDRLAAAGVEAISISIDGATAETHDGIRGVPGTFVRSFEVVRHAVSVGLKVQINTAVMSSNLLELPALFESIHTVPVHIWEMFFLIHTGRGKDLCEATPAECEAVCHFLYRSAHYGITVRTVEAPFYRRLVRQYEEGRAAEPDALARQLTADLERRVGPPTNSPRARSAGTRDGKGIVFVAHDGSVSPSGFLPLDSGNVRDQSLVTIYRENAMFRQLRAGAALKGVCGGCDWREICGGSRARAFAHKGDALAEDPACIFTLEPRLARS